MDKRKQRGLWLGLSIFVVCLLAVFLASRLSHPLPDYQGKSLKDWTRQCGDH